jgi:hypothetical protein
MKIVTTVCALVLSFLFAFNVHAFGKSLQGAIASLNSTSLTVQDNDQGSVPVEIDQNTQYKEVNALMELRRGDKVRVDYKEAQGRKIATKVSRISTGGIQP